MAENSNIIKQLQFRRTKIYNSKEEAEQAIKGFNVSEKKLLDGECVFVVYKDKGNTTFEIVYINKENVIRYSESSLNKQIEDLKKDVANNEQVQKNVRDLEDIKKEVAKFNKEIKELQAQKNQILQEAKADTQSQIKTALSSVMVYKGAVATKDNLPKENQKVGDYYNAIDTDVNYAWNGSTWDEVGATKTVDLSGYYKKSEVDNKIEQSATDTLKNVPKEVAKVVPQEVEKIVTKEVSQAVPTAIEKAKPQIIEEAVKQADNTKQIQELTNKTDKSLVSIKFQYAVSKDGTKEPSDGWKDTFIKPSQEDYLWQRTVVTPLNGKSITGSGAIVSYRNRDITKGDNAYIHIAYADDKNGGGFSLTNDTLKKPYLGIYSDFKQEGTSNPQDYKWNLIQGEAKSINWNNITGKPLKFTPETHAHTLSDISDISLGYKTNSKNYAVQKDDSNKLFVNVPWEPGKIDDSTISPIIQSYLQKHNINTNWESITNKPSVFKPDKHTHTTSEITDFTRSINNIVNPAKEELNKKDVKQVTVSGDKNKTITLTLNDGTTIKGQFTDIDTVSNVDKYINSLEFNKGTGLLQGKTSYGETVSVNLDGRYSLLNHDHKEYAKLNHSHNFSELKSTPTTLEGYKITDAASKNHKHSIDDLTDYKKVSIYAPSMGRVQTQDRDGDLVFDEGEGIRFSKRMESSGGLIISSTVTKESLGLGNVDNTSDSDKPVSTKQQKAITQACETVETKVDGQIKSLDSKVTGIEKNLTSYVKKDGDIMTGPLTATAFYQSSDIRLKENIEDVSFEKSLDIINTLKPVYYNFKDNPNKREVGFIAQDVKEVLPEVVNENEKGYLAIDYSKLSVILYKGLQNINNRLTKIENILSKNNLI